MSPIRKICGTFLFVSFFTVSKAQVRRELRLSLHRKHNTTPRGPAAKSQRKLSEHARNIRRRSPLDESRDVTPRRTRVQKKNNAVHTKIPRTTAETHAHTQIHTRHTLLSSVAAHPRAVVCCESPVQTMLPPPPRRRLLRRRRRHNSGPPERRAGNHVALASVRTRRKRRMPPEETVAPGAAQSDDQRGGVVVVDRASQQKKSEHRAAKKTKQEQNAST